MLWKQNIYVNIHRVVLRIPGDNWYNILAWFMACNKNSVNIVCYHYSELQKYYTMELKFEFSEFFCLFCLLFFLTLEAFTFISVWSQQRPVIRAEDLKAITSVFEWVGCSETTIQKSCPCHVRSSFSSLSSHLNREIR